MANALTITVDNPDQLLNAGAYGTGALIRVQSATALAGPYADLTGTGATPTVPIVSAVTAYEAFDPGGGSSTWYRSRYENATATRASDWTASFQVGALAYASLADLREYINPPDTSQDNLLQDLLIRASAYLDGKCGRDFYRHPITGTEVRLFAGSGSRLLEVRAGIVSLTTVEVAPAAGASYTALASTDWVLWPWDKAPDRTYDGIALSDISAYRYWYPGLDTVRLTGTFGWATVPTMIEQATLDLAREWYRQGPGGGGPIGVNQFGTPIFGGGEPRSVREAIDRYRWGVLVA